MTGIEGRRDCPSDENKPGRRGVYTTQAFPIPLFLHKFGRWAWQSGNRFTTGLTAEEVWRSVTPCAGALDLGRIEPSFV